MKKYLQTTVVASLLAVTTLFLTGSAAKACDPLPIGLSAASLANAQEGTVLRDSRHRHRVDAFEWLTWTGKRDERTLAKSLTPPGDSETYVNPLDPNDHDLKTGDWVYGRPDEVESRRVHAAVEALVGLEVVVPIWDVKFAHRGTVAYHVVGFARIKIVSYNHGKITAEFIGYENCDGEVNT